ncbi:hypothetical protein CHS0354_018509 [Potamilus streckersoni]|uniref:Exonuclease domain-containing protein n=1 Tax=Potamilus streckersoni TaxID=2493646 RepID=A0AAE0W9D0_9BIVA|nr:hypothetical protein CHS0354_018509 [Potamilus streckersoni]
MPTNLYGPGDNYDLQNSHVLPALLRKFHEAKQNNSPEVEIWGDGTPLREFLHTDDLARASVMLMNDYQGTGMINIGTAGKYDKIRHGIYRQNQVNKDKPNGTPRKLLDISRLTALGWRPQIELEDVDHYPIRNIALLKASEQNVYLQIPMTFNIPGAVGNCHFYYLPATKTVVLPATAEYHPPLSKKLIQAAEQRVLHYILNFALDKIFRILFHEDIPVHLKNLVLLVNPDFLDYAELIKSRLEADERFNSEDGLNWNLNPSNSYTHLNSPYRKQNIEATGSVFGQDRMIEIGAVKMKNGKITDTFHRFINPGIRLPFQIMKMTGLRAADLEDKPGIDAVLPEFAKFRGNAVFCAHNADFDLNFICYELNRIGADMFSGIPEICTLRLARKLIPSMHAHGVAALSEHFNYRLQKHHSAIEDAKATQIYCPK